MAGAAGLVRPPAYLPQNQRLAQLRAALPQGWQAKRPPASPPPAVPPARVLKQRGTNRVARAWTFLVSLGVLLFGTGVGDKIVRAVTEWLHRR